jgi:fermentation-respiration switch protein FrsA (DUF1100 family)
MTPVEQVRFGVDGITLAGHLRVPPPAAGQRQPAVVVAGPSPQVKEQAPDVYAERLTAEGYATLTLDYRNFGESGGAPRQREDPAGKLADLRAAVSFLARQPAVDPARIAMVGVCAGGGYALKAAAFDRRIRAFAGIAGFYPSPSLLRDAMGAEAYQAALAEAVAVLAREDQGEPVQYLPHVTPQGGGGFMQGGEPYEYYGSPRGQAAGYRNQLTADTAYTVLTLDNATAADFLSPTPALIVHGETDDYCLPGHAQAVYDRFGDPKHLVWLPTTTHIGFYDDDAYITPAVAETVSFLGAHLG